MVPIEPATSVANMSSTRLGWLLIAALLACKGGKQENEAASPPASVATPTSTATDPEPVPKSVVPEDSKTSSDGAPSLPA
jgi:hypothetical protein